MSGKIGIVILNWNDPFSTLTLVKDIIDISIDYKNYTIYVVDNGSTDTSIREIDNFIFVNKDYSHKIDFLKNENNLGYARGNNVGLKKAFNDGCEFILVLNNDIKIEVSFLSKLVSYYRSDSKIGILTPVILNEDYSIQKWCARKKTKVIHRIVVFSPLSRLFKNTNIYKNYFYEFSRTSRPFEIELFSGAAFFTSADLLNRIDYFDENTFLYEEELILGEKIANLRRKFFILPEIYLIHTEGKSTKKIGLNKYKYMIESERYYLNKYSKEKFLFAKKLPLVLLRYTIYLLKYLSNNLFKKGI